MFWCTMSVIFLALVASAVAREDRAPKQLRCCNHCGSSAQRRSIFLQAACTLFGERADSQSRDRAGPAAGTGGSGGARCVMWSNGDRVGWRHALYRGPSVVNPCLFGLRQPIGHKTISSCPVICLCIQKGIQESTWTRTPEACLERLQTGVSLS